MHTPGVDTRAGDPFVCAACQGGAHERCISREVCECVHEKAAWLTPDRRTALRAGDEPRNQLETGYQAAYRAHQSAREEADGRRS